MTAPAPSVPTQKVKRHPIRATLSGLLLGIGLALLLISFSVIALGTMTPFVVMGLCTVLGLVLSFVVPPSGRAG